MAVKRKRGGIKNWPESERPRERLLRTGPETLSDAELLAIILSVGRTKSSAVEVARELLERLDGLQGLSNRGMQELCAVPGIGPWSVPLRSKAVKTTTLAPGAAWRMWGKASTPPMPGITRSRRTRSGW